MSKIKMTFRMRPVPLNGKRRQVSDSFKADMTMVKFFVRIGWVMLIPRQMEWICQAVTRLEKMERIDGI